MGACTCTVSARVLKVLWKKRCLPSSIESNGGRKAPILGETWKKRIREVEMSSLTFRVRFQRNLQRFASCSVEKVIWEKAGSHLNLTFSSGVRGVVSLQTTQGFFFLSWGGGGGEERGLDRQGKIAFFSFPGQFFFSFRVENVKLPFLGAQVSGFFFTWWLTCATVCVCAWVGRFND